MSAKKVITALKSVSSKEKAKVSAWFFKTGKGEYGEGDIFIGVTVPEQRKIAKRFFSETDLGDIEKLLQSPIHEHRFTALEMLCFKYSYAETEKEKKQIVDFYLKNLKLVNNWDLVDTSAYELLGEWLAVKKDRKILYKLAISKNIWERRISIVSTYAFIKQNDLGDTFAISKILIGDKHDLIHKAVGWMLREAGKKSLDAEEKFLKIHYKNMPRTMLRYAIERFPEPKRKAYLSGLI
jgi:3-methyladenine DNA glycosylase AlkD